MWRSSLVTLCAFALLAGVAHAEEDYARSGPYFQVGGTTTFENFQSSFDPPGLDTDESLGVNARIGSRLMPHYALELEFEWIDEFEFGTVPVTGIEAWTFSLNNKLHILTGQTQPFVLLGIGYLHIDPNGGGISDNGLDDMMFRLGAGLDFYATEKVVASADVTYILPTSVGDSLHDFQYITFGWGLQYRL